MLTFDSFTLVPTYSEIPSRSLVDVSTKIAGRLSKLPIINANMHSLCTVDMMAILAKEYKTFCSYHRFFKSTNEWYRTLGEISDRLGEDCKYFFPSVGVKKEDFDAYETILGMMAFENIIVDVNHGHHKAVADIIKKIKEDFPQTVVMAGNVSSTDGVKFLYDAGADIIKIGNSFGFSCTTKMATGFGVHPVHVAKTYREETANWDTPLCIDGGIRDVSDIAKSMIWADLVMVGRMFAGSDESHGRFIKVDGHMAREYYGNASVYTKSVSNNSCHIRYVEGETKTVPYTGPMKLTLDTISDGLQGAYSFVGAKDTNEYQLKAPPQVLRI